MTAPAMTRRDSRRVHKPPGTFPSPRFPFRRPLASSRPGARTCRSTISRRWAATRTLRRPPRRATSGLTGSARCCAGGRRGRDASALRSSGYVTRDLVLCLHKLRSLAPSSRLYYVDSCKSADTRTSVRSSPSSRKASPLASRRATPRPPRPRRTRASSRRSASSRSSVSSRMLTCLARRARRRRPSCRRRNRRRRKGSSDISSVPSPRAPLLYSLATETRKGTASQKRGARTGKDER